MAETNAATEFLEGLAARNFDRLAASLTAGATARMLLPRGPEEHSGRESIVGRIEGWFGSASEFALQSASDEVVGARRRVGYRLSVVRDGQTRELIDQVAFLDVGPGGIERIDLLCSGFQVEPGAGAAAQVFDAGTLGCADGLAQEFQRRLSRVRVGGSLKVVVRDPAAKEDLPSLARLLGHRVTSTEAHDDGRLTISLEKRK